MTTRRVFVLGSGFSASAGLPILGELFGKAMEFKATRDSHEEDKQRLRDALAALYPHFQSDVTKPSYPPFEEFLSLVVAAREFVTGGRDWGQVETGALRLLSDYLDSTSKDLPPDKEAPLNQFVDRLRPGDVVITFNWDYLVERRLFDSRKMDANFLARDRHGIAIFKLHGSIGWCRIPDEPREPPDAVEIRHRVFRLRDYAYYDLWGRKNWPPLIVPPTHFKRPEVDPFLNPIWCEAFNSLVEADSLCIIGYSLPADDLQARALLSSGLSRRSERLQERGMDSGKYLLVDPNPSVREKYFSQVAENVTFLQKRFEDAVDEVLAWSGTAELVSR